MTSIPRFIKTPDGVYRCINSLIGLRATKNIFTKKWIIESSWINMDMGGYPAYGSFRKVITIDELKSNGMTDKELELKAKNRLNELINTDPSEWWAN